jgi:threonine/homoserine/homoserine lactone efflux protein
VGALYIAWIGVSLLRSQSTSQPGSDAVSGSPVPVHGSAWTTFRQALTTCLLNPKAYLFMLAVFPQFLRVEYGAVWIQALALGGIIAVTQIAVYGGLALVAGSSQGWLSGRPAASLVIARLAGGMLLLGALVTIVGVMGAH